MQVSRGGILAAMAAVSPVPPLLLGLEEEVFAVYRAAGGYRTSTASLLGLARLLWRERQAGATASNFRRGPVAWRELMSSVEVSTGARATPAELLRDVQARRAALGAALPMALLLPLGLLPASDEYHTAGLHLHVGVPAAQLARAYGNLARYLPVLAHATASSPWWAGAAGGPMQRPVHSFALGALGPDPLARFQDLIVTRRLGTIELRVLDPVWDPARLHAVVAAAAAVATLPRALPWSRSAYNALRPTYQYGLDSPGGETVRALARELHERCGFDPALIENTEAGRVLDSYRAVGEAATWQALNGGYRTGQWGSLGQPHPRPARWQGPLGFAAYYVPKLPYMLGKVRAEHHAPWRDGELTVPEVDEADTPPG